MGPPLPDFYNFPNPMSKYDLGLEEQKKANLLNKMFVVGRGIRQNYLLFDEGNPPFPTSVHMYGENRLTETL